MLADIHQRQCGNHVGKRILAHRVINLGYYWSYMQRDEAQFVQACEQCQRYVPYQHLPS